MIKLLNEKKYPLYKIQEAKKVQLLEFECFASLQNTCCGINILDNDEISYLLDLRENHKCAEFEKKLDYSLLKPLSEAQNLTLALSTVKIKKFSKLHADIFQEYIFGDTNQILQTYFLKQKIDIKVKTLDYLIDYYSDDIFGIINEVYLLFLQNSLNTDNLTCLNLQNQMFYYIDKFLVDNHNLESFNYFIHHLVEAGDFLKFLSLLVTKLELMLNLKILIQFYNLQEITSLLNKNAYYIKNTLLLTNKLTFQKIEHIINNLAEIDFLYKTGKKTIYESITKLTL